VIHGKVGDDEGSSGGKPMINMVLLLMLLAAGYFYAHVEQLYRYDKTRYKPSLYLSVACFIFALALVLALLIGAANSINNLPLVKFFARWNVTLVALGFVFLNMFAIALTRPGGKMRNVWISFVSFLVLAVGVWMCNIFVGRNIGGMPIFTETSMYKAPYGLPIVEEGLALMAVMVAHPVYLFFRGVKKTKDKVVKAKSFFMGIGMIISTAGYAIEISGAIPYQYMFIAIPMMMVGAYMTFLAYDLPRKIETMISGHVSVSADSVESFIEKFFASPVKPTERTQLHVFSKALGLNHQQVAGRNILFEFDPASNYEEAIQDFATEALANAETTIIFTRMGSTIHSSMKQQKAVKFFCLTQQVSVPKELSENKMLLPTNDTSLILDVLNKTLKTHPEAKINIVFDSLSDLIMSIGFEKTYRLIRYAIELLASPRITVLFLLNQTAHDPELVNGFRSLFSNQISYGKKGMQPVKLFAHALYSAKD
jgi:hypothetical protein